MCIYILLASLSICISQYIKVLLIVCIYVSKINFVCDIDFILQISILSVYLISNI